MGQTNVHTACWTILFSLHFPLPEGKFKREKEKRFSLFHPIAAKGMVNTLTMGDSGICPEKRGLYCSFSLRIISESTR